MAEGFISLVDEYLQMNYIDPDDCLVLAGMAEIRSRLYKKLDSVQGEYSLKLTPVQAIALHLFYTTFINEPTSYVGNKLHLISNEVAKTYGL